MKLNSVGFIGVEPIQADPNSTVLPLHKKPK